MQETYMRRAIELAKKGIGAVNPNPLVGAVIVRMGGLLVRDITENTESFMRRGMHLHI